MAGCVGKMCGKGVDPPQVEVVVVKADDVMVIEISRQEDMVGGVRLGGIQTHDGVNVFPKSKSDSLS